MSLEYRRIHIVGAGGAGMSALAKVLLGRGHEVSGSDLRGGPSLESLSDMGAEVFIGHHPDAVEDADVVVASSAVPDYDEELQRARELGIPTWRRPQLLEAITAEIPTIGATGTHGKTTTTAMLLSALRSCGMDPSFVIGGEIAELGTNGHVGEDDLLVLEADEAFRTFETLHMEGLIVTNAEPEHLDHFGTEADLLTSFSTVASRVAGPVVACLDDAGASVIARDTGSVTYGFSEGTDWNLTQFEPSGEGSRFTLIGRERPYLVELTLPGVHNALNAAGALALVGELGYDVERALIGIAGFKGVGRRWEHRGVVDGVMLVDDYAHHPTEVRAVLGAARSLGANRLVAVFQPHLYSRTERFSDQFGDALAMADVVVVTDVFGARETPVPGITGELVADAARDRGVEVHYLPHRSEVAQALVPLIMTGDLVVSMGAGDITLLHNELAVLLAERA